MEKIDLDNVYFHGIRPPCDNEDAALEILENILKHNAILSRGLQDELGIKSILNANLNRNGKDNISICCSRSDAFINWVRNQISIILPKNMPECIFVDKYDFSGIDGEFQIKSSIPSKYFIGIGIPTGTSSFKQIISDINCCAQGSQEYFIEHLERYYKREISPVQEVLNKTGYDIALYDIQTGELIPTFKELCESNDELSL